MQTLLKVLSFLARAALVGIVATLAFNGNYILANAVVETVEDDDEDE
jgi:hypothetical protein